MLAAVLGSLLFWQRLVLILLELAAWGARPKPSGLQISLIKVACCCVVPVLGFLLFWQSLVLILLEGTSKDVSQYLYLARTVCVDVDASGRKVGA